MTRITKALTEEILKNALSKSGVTEGEHQLAFDRSAWLERCRIFSLGGEESVAEMEKTLTKIAALRAKLPDGVDAGYSINQTRGSVSLNIAGMRVDMVLPGRIACPHRITITADNRLAAEFGVLENRSADLKARKEQVKTNLLATIGQFSTVAKLLDSWPEAAELIPAAQAPKAKLPVVQVADLNKIIGLPSDK